ncbi:MULTISPECIES: hypothetical protein [unclassified Streptomyces]|uniref:hypothetical protein n=1 Tax=unclassified Streptomyces TaxID=2593676 RepID=UPI0036AAE2EE
MVLEGGARLRPGTVDSRRDHRIAVAAAVAAACAAAGESLVNGWDSVATGLPGVPGGPGTADRGGCRRGRGAGGHGGGAPAETGAG